jgi:hypothetical protein
MSVREVSCPSCEKVISVPPEAIGKRIRCKACAHVFTVPAPAAKPASAKPAAAKPATAKPAAAKPASPPPPSTTPVPDDAPIAFDEDDPNAPKMYDVTKDDLDKARCPFCAKELEDEEARICLNCGYDMEQRRRHSSKKTYNRTTGDYVLWWLPAVIWAITLLLLLTVLIWMCVYFSGIVQKYEMFSFMKYEDENKLTGQKDYFIHPMACDVCCGINLLALSAFGVPVIVRRLKSFAPPEQEKKK